MKPDPTVSVIIPTYNYGRLIGEAIESVINSNFPQEEVEIVIVDDGSTDDTEERIKVYSDRVNYIFQENAGKAQATRVAIENTHGRYIFNLDADDFFLPNKLRATVECFESDSKLTHVGHPALFWNVDTNTETSEEIPQEILGKKILGKDLLTYFYRRRILFGGGSTFAARADVMKALPIPREVDMYMDEYLLLTTLNQGYSFLLEEPLSIWRIHTTNFSQNKSADSYKLQRSLNSVEAVLKQMSVLDFDEELRRLYQLKTMSLSLAIKEQLEQKTWSDIMHLLRCMSDNARFFGWDIVEIVKNQHLLNRILPTPVIKLLKQNSAS